MNSSSVDFHSFPSITLETLKKYASASGDFNEIHTNESVAKKVGLPGIIAHGMLIAAYIARRAQDYAEQECSLKDFEMAEFQTRFKAMTLLGDTPSVGGTVRTQSESELILDLVAKNQKGEVTTTGIAKFKRHPA
ncbi:MAG: dehydratase [Bdellovibrio sp.]|nr:dehydratase [Bdellovibrio sp.]